jgi:hypothetical protein
MFLEIGAPVFDASIVALIGCGWENATDDTNTVVSSNNFELADARKTRSTFRRAPAFHRLVAETDPCKL